MPELTTAEKLAMAMELSTEILVGIIRRRAIAKNSDVGTLLAEAAANSQEADQILDALEDKGHEPPEGTEAFEG